MDPEKAQRVQDREWYGRPQEEVAHEVPSSGSDLLGDPGQVGRYPVKFGVLPDGCQGLGTRPAVAGRGACDDRPSLVSHHAQSPSETTTCLKPCIAVGETFHLSPADMVGPE